jgi:hypothetical protein
VKTALIGLTLAATLFAVPLVKRDVLNSLEKGFSQSLIAGEMEILGYPSGLYIDGTGIVFTSEINLSYAPRVDPFQQVIPPATRVKVHDKELQQLPVLRELMTQLLLKSSVTLDTLPPGEKIVVGVKLTHQAWEDKTGFPDQIVMQGVKSKLMDAKFGRVSPSSVIQVQE